LLFLLSSWKQKRLTVIYDAQDTVWLLPGSYRLAGTSHCTQTTSLREMIVTDSMKGSGL
jgi:hypothetical protein